MSVTYQEKNIFQTENWRKFKKKEETVNDIVFEEFIGTYEDTGKARYSVTTERRDLLTLSKDYSMVHSTPARELASILRKKFGQLPKLQDQLPVPGKVLKIQDFSL